MQFDIQGWLIYGAGETVPLLWVFMRRRSWQPPPPPNFYSIMKPRSHTHTGLRLQHPDPSCRTLVTFVTITVPFTRRSRMVRYDLEIKMRFLQVKQP